MTDDEDNSNKQAFEENAPTPSCFSSVPANDGSSDSDSPGENNQERSAHSVLPPLLQGPSSSQVVHQGRNNPVASADDQNAQEMLQELDTSAAEKKDNRDDTDTRHSENDDDDSCSPLETDDEATLRNPFDLSLVSQAFLLFDDDDDDNDCTMLPLLIPNDDDDDEL